MAVRRGTRATTAPTAPTPIPEATPTPTPEPSIWLRVAGTKEPSGILRSEVVQWKVVKGADIHVRLRGEDDFRKIHDMETEGTTEFGKVLAALRMDLAV